MQDGTTRDQEMVAKAAAIIIADKASEEWANNAFGFLVLFLGFATGMFWIIGKLWSLVSPSSCPAFLLF